MPSLSAAGERAALEIFQSRTTLARRTVSRQQSAFTLGDLLAQEDLGLEMLTGGVQALERRVAGAHSIEIDHPATWLERDWIMLTTGVRLRHSAGAQRLLIAELEAAGAAALGFGVELVFRRVPSALLAEARARSFPVFATPLSTPFREIVSSINRALVSSDLRALQRLSSMQLYLMDALGEDDPRAAVLARLASFVDATVLLFAPDGSVEAATGDAPADAIWQAITAHPAALVEFGLDGWHTVATPVGTGGAPSGWLALTSRRPRWVNRHTKPAARATAPVLAALARLGGVAREQDRAIRGALVEQLLEPIVGREAATLAARAASLGIDFSAPARVVLVRRRAAGDRARARVDLGAVRARLEQRLDAAGLRHLVARRPGAVIAVAQGAHERLRSAIADLVDDQPGIAAGIGRPVNYVEAVRHSLRDAEIAVQRLAQDPRRRLLDFADFDLGTLVVSESPAERIQPKVDECLGALRANPGLLAALVAYFQHGLDVMRAAEAMHLHHNTVRYRLSRVERLLDRPLKDPATIASLYIALMAAPPEVEVPASGAPGAAAGGSPGPSAGASASN
jgi:purine catabolism regulator